MLLPTELWRWRSNNEICQETRESFEANGKTHSNLRFPKCTSIKSEWSRRTGRTNHRWPLAYNNWFIISQASPSKGKSCFSALFYESMYVLSQQSWTSQWKIIHPNTSIEYMKERKDIVLRCKNCTKTRSKKPDSSFATDKNHTLASLNDNSQSANKSKHFSRSIHGAENHAFADASDYLYSGKQDLEQILH